NSDEGKTITTDDAGNIYVTGYFCGTATFGSYSLTSSGIDDIFVAKMDADGIWQWAKQAGGSFEDSGKSIALDSAGNSYVTGHFEGTAIFGSTSLTSSGSTDIFVAKLDVDGNWLYAISAGGSCFDFGCSIALDSAGNSYVTGKFYGTATFGSASLTSCGYYDIFVAKMDADGNWQWATRAGGSSGDSGTSIVLDSAGNSYVTGDFKHTATFGFTSLTSNEYPDIFIAKMDADGNWQWATRAGGSSYDYCGCIALDSAGNSYVTGKFIGTAIFGSISLTSSGLDDIFVAKMDADGIWQWATRAGGSDYDCGYSIALDSAGNSYVTGHFEGTAIFGSISLTSSSGSYDVFAAKMDVDGIWQWATRAGGSGIGSDCGYSIALDSVGNSYVTGCFYETATFGSTSLTSCGSHDIFVAKLNSSVSANSEIYPDVNILSNYPNPFNPTTRIHYSIIEKSNVRINVFNIKGQLVK
ncbi:MAG: SBBP repeat-containing protein, partial [Candidatus Cloacimonetes bacterium]|nr:SBBP repeat-containing protein [Candidatus Cloacimonadota bacterium]